jgi:hypothetical protein
MARTGPGSAMTVTRTTSGPDPSSGVRLLAIS